LVTLAERDRDWPLRPDSSSVTDSAIAFAKPDQLTQPSLSYLAVPKQQRWR